MVKAQERIHSPVRPLVLQLVGDQDILVVIGHVLGPRQRLGILPAIHKGYKSSLRLLWCLCSAVPSRGRRVEDDIVDALDELQLDDALDGEQAEQLVLVGLAGRLAPVAVVPRRRVADVAVAVEQLRGVQPAAGTGVPRVLVVAGREPGQQLARDRRAEHVVEALEGQTGGQNREKINSTSTKELLGTGCPRIRR